MANLDREAVALLAKMAPAEIADYILQQPVDEVRNTIVFIVESLRGLVAVPVQRCPRCGMPLNNVSPGYSMTAGGYVVCTPCLRPGEERARARGMVPPPAPEGGPGPTQTKENPYVLDSARCA